MPTSTATSNAASSAVKPVTTRLLSIDALRGFDMFWIIGGEELFKELVRWPVVSDALKRWTDYPVQATVEQQLDHVQWEGFHFYDLIFPLFLFLVGVVIPFSLGALRERGETKGKLYWRILRRTVLLFFLGLLFNGFMQFDFANLRTVGVLQRIALCYGIAALIVMNTGVIVQFLLTVAILVGYWALLAYVPAPGQQPGDLSIEHNLAGWLDREYLATVSSIKKAYYGFGDNEGILSTIPAIATTLLGALTGHWLRSGQAKAVKLTGLILAGAALLAMGYYWGHSFPSVTNYVIPAFPIIKILWTSSYVLVAGGWSLLLLALFYGVIDVVGLRAWSIFFVVIGVNAITIYVLQERIIDFQHMAHFFLSGTLKLTDAAAHPLILAFGDVMLKWLFLFFLYRNRIYLRV
jgi:predicted acyltransferase